MSALRTYSNISSCFVRSKLTHSFKVQHKIDASMLLQSSQSIDTLSICHLQKRSWNPSLIASSPSFSAWAIWIDTKQKSMQIHVPIALLAKSVRSTEPQISRVQIFLIRISVVEKSLPFSFSRSWRRLLKAIFHACSSHFLSMSLELNSTLKNTSLLSSLNRPELIHTCPKMVYIL